MLMNYSNPFVALFLLATLEEKKRSFRLPSVQSKRETVFICFTEAKAIQTEACIARVDVLLRRGVWATLYTLVGCYTFV